MKILPNPSARLFFEKYFEALPSEYEVEVARFAQLLARQFLSSIGLPTPFFLVIDNSLIQDLLHAGKKAERKIRATALLFFTHYLKEKLAAPVYIAVTPITLYEFIGKRALRDEIDFKDSLLSLKTLLAGINFPVLPFRIGDFQEADDNIKRIAWDNEELTEKVRLIRQKKWDIRINSEAEMFQSFDIARRHLPEPFALRYLNENFVRYTLTSLIQMLIWESPVQSKHLRKKFSELPQTSVAKILKIKSGDLKGLGDVQIFSLCSIRSQFIAEQHFTFVALTADEILHAVLKDFTQRTRSVSNMDEAGTRTSEREIARFGQETELDIRNMNFTNETYSDFNSFLVEVLGLSIERDERLNKDDREL